ncbi:N-acetylglucosamine-6-phosphate deacetylase [Paenibacillus sp. UMB4589-SE434]|uniref:N-acetylglucosamine-6-phosphate deacetylase n=1 Tax=Paenibacillus sp. UMB4589-SE434 TaxID=3046314 RepID=UPI00254A612D|nr:N-acetylglucosamine-6-phosphate deacetylase [Paenibacillus sp. UMB4589-SE434]MDK8183685.1 N-acetylglucosamine-6-phosphate deacetylase [Paenibacillus sp. UMB4589-SE434]
MTNSTFTLKNARLVTLNGLIHDGIVRVEDGRIAYIGTLSQLTPVEQAWLTDAIDADNGYVMPGFIDVHVHGGFGADFMDASHTAYDQITKFHMEHGTTTMLATSMTQSHEALDKVVDAVDAYMKSNSKYAQLAGLHLEGPFVNPKYKGAQNDAFMMDAQIDWLEGWHEHHPGVMKQLSLAPERDNALNAIRWCRAHGINAAAAHTDATYEQLTEAANAGLNQAVHTFNAMTPVHHRNPGVAGGVLTDDRIAAEVIADGHHVHPACIKLLVRSKAAGKLILITDAMSAAGMPNGQYDLGGLPVTVIDGVARLTEGGSLAGSTLTMIGAIQFVTRHVGLSVEEASKLASINPAKQIGIDDVTGSIEVGKQADLVWTDAELNIKKVWAKGRTHM